MSVFAFASSRIISVLAWYGKGTCDAEIFNELTAPQNYAALEASDSASSSVRESLATVRPYMNFERPALFPQRFLALSIGATAATSVWRWIAVFVFPVSNRLPSLASNSSFCRISVFSARAGSLA